MFKKFKRAGREGGDFFNKLWRWFFPTADEIRWALEQSIPPDEHIEWFVREAKTPTHFRVAIAATNRHLVILSHFFIWRYYDFHPWNKLKDVNFTESPYHSKIIMTRIDTQKRVIIKHIESERGRLLAGHARKMIAVHEADKIALGKQCPYCKELVKYNATICPNCHHELTNPLAPSPSPQSASKQPNPAKSETSSKPDQEPKK